LACWACDTRTSSGSCVMIKSRLTSGPGTASGSSRASDSGRASGSSWTGFPGITSISREPSPTRGSSISCPPRVTSVSCISRVSRISCWSKTRGTSWTRRADGPCWTKDASSLIGRIIRIQNCKISAFATYRNLGDCIACGSCTTRAGWTLNISYLLKSTVLVLNYQISCCGNVNALNIFRFLVNYTSYK
jgi:hypothetical protein